MLKHCANSDNFSGFCNIIPPYGVDIPLPHNSGKNYFRAFTGYTYLFGLSFPVTVPRNPVNTLFTDILDLLNLYIINVNLFHLFMINEVL